MKFIDMLVNAFYDFKIDHRIFENEKNAIKEELNNLINNSEYEMIKFFNKTYFKNNIREVDEETKFNNIKNVKPEQIESYFYENYNPNNILFCFFGELNMKNIISIFDKYPYKTKMLTSTKKLDKFTIQHTKKINFLKENKKNNILKIVFNVDYSFMTMITIKSMPY